MNRLVDQIKQAFDALAFADIGERVGRRAMYEALCPDHAQDQASTPACPTPTASSRRLIALGVGEFLAPAVMTYAIGACHRMNAELLFLTLNATRLREQITPYRDELGTIGCEAEELPDTARRTLLGVLAKRSNVLFAVSGGQDDPVSVLVRGKRGLLDGRTPVPVVVVSPEPRKKTTQTTCSRLVTTG